ncbi:MAG: serine hydrolase [Pseudomonadota bacterium]
MHRRDFLGFAALGLGALAAPARAAPRPDAIWREVFARMPPAVAAIAFDPAHAVQLRWVRIASDADGTRRYVAHDFGWQPRRWFPAASVVKLPMALLMAEAVQAAGGDPGTILRLDAPPATGAWGDEPPAETFARGIARTFAVSDNVPFNRWYELLGGDRIHARLAELGYPHVRLISRLGSSDREANRRTGGGALFAADGRELRRFAPGTAAERRFPFGEARLGAGWREDDGRLVPGPRDFSRANALPLADSLGMLQAFIAPESVPERRRWRIDGAMRARLLRALALRPRESDDPVYPEAQFPDGYARWFFVGDGRAQYPDGLTVFGKSGMAYGTLSEVAWVVDLGVDGGPSSEFLLAASLHANADGILNDDRYDYDTVALPFLAAWSRAVLEIERERRAGRRAQR